MPPHPHPLRPVVLGAVAVGGATGACLRWQLGEWFPVPAASFPWTTFGINVAGSLLLATLAGIEVVRRHPVLPPALGTGVLGGFTTLSAYSEETRSLLAGGHGALAAAYLLGTLGSCLLAVALVDLVTTAPERLEFEDEEGDL